MQKNVNTAKNGLKKKQLNGFKGWLAIVVATVFIYLINIIYYLVHIIKTTTNPQTIITISIFFISFLWLNIVMLKKKKTFKFWFLGILTAKTINRIVVISLLPKDLYTKKTLTVLYDLIYVLYNIYKHHNFISLDFKKSTKYLHQLT